MTLIDCFNSGIPAKEAAKLCHLPYARVQRTYQDLHMEEYSGTGIVKRNLAEINKIERDLWILITQVESSNDPHLKLQLDSQQLLYVQFNALDIHQTI